MTRIAHIIHGWPPETMGGTGLYVDAIATEQARAGNPTAIVAPNPGKQTKQNDVASPVEHWRIETSRVNQWTDTWNGSLNGWTTWCAHWKPDVVHIHHLSGWPLGLIEATACRTVLTLHDYSIPCARGQLMTHDLNACNGPTPTQCTQCLGPALRTHPLLERAGRALQSFPAISTVARRVISTRRTAFEPAVQERLIAAKKAIEAADAVLAPSTDLIQRMVNLGYPKAKRVELPLLQPAAPIPADSQGPVRFLFASTIIPTKGPDRLIEAFLNLKEDATLTIAGHSPDFPGRPDFAAKLQSRIKGHANIQWMGPIPASEIPQLMAKHDVLALPSLWPENSPLVVREATAAGLQIIASKTGGTKELAPAAVLVESDADLLAAMTNMAQEGRMRHPPTQWQTPAEHAKKLLHGAYISVQA